MTDVFDPSDSCLYTRRNLLVNAAKTLVGAALLSVPFAAADSAENETSFRSVNIVNFIRAEEPRNPMDLILPVREQMEIIKSHGFPATWLLQYDALVEGPFVEFLKTEMLPSHEVGFWFEMNRKICDDAGIAWRGNPDWEWDYHVPVAYAIGYSPDERRRLIDTAATTFQRVFGMPLKSVGSWNLDAISVEHFSDKYSIDAFANCRDQLATDGFTIWGAPIAGYYPNRLNAWSPAIEKKNQISSPIFRMLGQDPVYYYDNQIGAPDTMEPVWSTGRSEKFVDTFYDMIAKEPTQSFAYAQLGQENSFGWPEMQEAFPMQMNKLADIAKESTIIIETMGETGRRFKRRFKTTPTQAQVMLDDPFGHAEDPQRTVWYQSKFYRANLHFRGTDFFLRDIHVYNDKFPQPYLTDPVRQHGIEERLLAVLDGYHWSDEQVRSGQSGVRAMGRFVMVTPDNLGGITLKMLGVPTVTETRTQLLTNVPLSQGGALVAGFREGMASFHLEGAPTGSKLALVFEWVPSLSTLQSVSADSLNYSFRDFAYTLRVNEGVASPTSNGAMITGMPNGSIKLNLVQGS